MQHTHKCGQHGGQRAKQLALTHLSLRLASPVPPTSSEQLPQYPICHDPRRHRCTHCPAACPTHLDLRTPPPPAFSSHHRRIKRCCPLQPPWPLSAAEAAPALRRAAAPTQHTATAAPSSSRAAALHPCQPPLASSLLPSPTASSRTVSPLLRPWPLKHCWPGLMSRRTRWLVSTPCFIPKPCLSLPPMTLKM